MDAPKCKVCGARHWSTQDHQWPQTVTNAPSVATKPEPPPSLTRASVTHATVTHGSRQARWRAAHPELHREQQRKYRARQRA